MYPHLNTAEEFLLRIKDYLYFLDIQISLKIQLSDQRVSEITPKQVLSKPRTYLVHQVTLH